MVHHRRGTAVRRVAKAKEENEVRRTEAKELRPRLTKGREGKSEGVGERQLSLLPRGNEGCAGPEKRKQLAITWVTEDDRLREQSNTSPYRGRPMRRERRARSTKRALRLRSRDRRLILRPLPPRVTTPRCRYCRCLPSLPRRRHDRTDRMPPPVVLVPGSPPATSFCIYVFPPSPPVTRAPSLFRGTAGSFDLSLPLALSLSVLLFLPSLVSINVPAGTTLRRGYLPSPYRFPSSACPPVSSSYTVLRSPPLGAD